MPIVKRPENLTHPASPATRVVLLDAVGTVLTLRRSVADCYHEAAQSAGIDLPIETIRARFPAAFARHFTPWQQRLPGPWAKQEHEWPANGEVVRNWLTMETMRAKFAEFFALPVNERLETNTWQSLVTEVLTPLDRPASRSATNTAFGTLWDLFAKPETWKAIEGASDLIARLRSEGIQVGLASNFDRRLHQILKGFVNELDFDHVFVSSDIGFRKPDPRFYQTIAELLAVSPTQIVMVGDRWWEDFAAPTVVGLQAFLYRQEPANSNCSVDQRPLNCLRTLTDLVV